MNKIHGLLIVSLFLCMFLISCGSANKQTLRSPEKIDEETRKDEIAEQELQKKDVNNKVEEKIKEFNEKADEESK